MKDFIIYSKNLIISIIEWWMSIPILTKITTTIAIGISSIWLEFSTFAYATVVLVFLDTHFGIKCATKKGIPYDSKKRRHGIIDKTILYFTVLVLMFIVDSVTLKVYDFEKHFFTTAVCFFIVLYEVTSIVEKLKEVYPNNQVILLLSKVFLLLKDKAEKKIEDKINDL